MRLSKILSSCIALSAFSANAADYLIQAPAFGFEQSYEGLSFQVHSGGCTSRDDFKVQKSGNLISIVQTSPDFCEAYLPYGTNVTFSYDDLGLQDGDTYKLSVDEFGPGRTVGANMVVNSMNGTQKSTSDIMGIKFSHDGVSLQVSSGGCTDKNDFSVVVRETFPTQTEINRINRDGCEAYLPYGTDVLFTGAELGLSESANRLRLILKCLSEKYL